MRICYNLKIVISGIATDHSATKNALRPLNDWIYIYVTVNLRIQEIHEFTEISGNSGIY